MKSALGFGTLLVLLVATSAPALDVYVAPGGNDTNPGTKDRPFATLARARDAVRDARHTAQTPINVVLRGGTYFLKEPLLLGPEDSGTKESPITYRAYKDEAVRLTGGPIIPTSAIEPVKDKQILQRLDPSARGKALQIDLKTLGVRSFGDAWPDRFSGYAGWPELFFDGKAMQLAKWPNDGFVKTGEILDIGSRPCVNEKPDRGGKFVYEGDRPSRWLTADEVYLNGYWCWKWAIEALKVAKIDTTAKTITFAAPHNYGIKPITGGEYHALNLLEELDAPGEYYLDRKTGVLYFWPPEDPAGKEISVSLATDPLVSMNQASHVRLVGLTFEVARGSGVKIEGGENDLIAGCTFRNLGQSAVVVDGGMHHEVRSCDLYSLGQGAICINGGDRRTLTACLHSAVNNHIYNFGRLYRTGSPAIALDGVGCVARNNLIHNGPHLAIDVAKNDHLVEFNEIHDVCLETDDAGGIYMGGDWASQGNIISYNYIHDLGGGKDAGNQGIYLDMEDSGITCIGNTICRSGRGFVIGGGRDNVVENNVMVDLKNPILANDWGMNVGREPEITNLPELMARLNSVPYRDEPWKSKFPHLALILDDDPGYPKRNSIQRNLMYRCGRNTVADNVQKYGTFKNNWETKEDPGLVDYETGMPRVMADATAYEKIPGFLPIPYEKIGLFKDRYRTHLPGEACAPEGKQTETQ